VIVIKNANCPNMIIFFLYLSGFVRFSNLYVRKTDKVVHTKVIIDNTIGKIADVFVHMLVQYAEVISITSHIINVIISIKILHITHAIRLHTEFINISLNVIFVGQKLILIYIMKINII